MSNYLYNGTELSALPEQSESDAEIYRYAHIYPTETGYTVTFKDRLSEYGTYTVAGTQYCRTHSKYAAGETIKWQRSHYIDGAWTSIETITGNNQATGGGYHHLWPTNEPIWSNYDIMNIDDDSVYLAASDPVSVLAVLMQGFLTTLGVRRNRNG